MAFNVRVGVGFGTWRTFAKMHICRRFAPFFWFTFALPSLLFAQQDLGNNDASIVLSQQHTIAGAFHSAPLLATDQAGGAFILFKSRRGKDSHVNLYLQHINQKGRPLLAANGVPICPQPANQAHAKQHFNTEVGLYVAWEEKRDGAHNDIFVQLVNDRGEPLWSPNGVRVSTSQRDKSNLQVLRDGSDGLSVFWEEADPLLNTRRIFGQRLSPTGERLWYDTGRPMLRPKGRQQGVQPAWAPGGHFILLWEDFRDSPSGELYVQKFDSSGAAVWHTGGRALRRSDIVRQRHPVVYGDGFGGVLCAYEGVRKSGDQAVLLLRVTRHGTLKYHKLVTLTTDDQNSPQIYQKGSRAVVVWQDQTDESTAHRLQMFNLRTGERVWRVTGYPISVGNTKQLEPQLVLSSVYGNLVLAWLEDTPAGQELFTQKIGRNMDKQWKATDIRLSERGEDLFDFSLVEDERGGAWYVWSVIAGEGTRLLYQGVDSYGELKFKSARPLLRDKREDEGFADHQSSNDCRGARWQRLHCLGRQPQRCRQYRHIRATAYPEGNIDWQPGGIAVATAEGDQSVPKLLPRDNGILVGWNDRRNSRDDNLYMQYLDTAGTSKWASGGQALCLARKSQSSLKFIPSIGDTSFAIWTDTRNLYASGFDLYMQKIDSAGQGCGLPMAARSQAQRATRLRRKSSRVTMAALWCLDGRAQCVLQRLPRRAQPTGAQAAQCRGWPDCPRAVSPALPQTTAARKRAVGFGL